MLYFPDQLYEERFRYFCLPLPDLLLDFLGERGLNIFCLPYDDDKAQDIVYNRLRISKEPLDSLPDLLPHEHPHYQVGIKTIILPWGALDNPGHNIVIHEIGHALDYLYLGNGRLISSTKTASHFLRKIPPLDDHCLVQDTKYENNVEQFATCFEAFFNEREPHLRYSDSYHSICQIDPGFVKLVNKYFIGPFSSDQGLQEVKSNG
jgi:hypothetical protein